LRNKIRIRSGYKREGWDKIEKKLYKDIIKYNLYGKPILIYLRSTKMVLGIKDVYPLLKRYQHMLDMICTETNLSINHKITLEGIQIHK
jgi:hypothetical protein